MAESFGHAKEWPAQVVQLGKPHIETLRALSRARNDPVFNEIADLIVSNNCAIRVWSQE